MAVPLRPKLRPLEIFPLGTRETGLFALRDPEGFCEMVPLPAGTALLATLMNGVHTLSEIRTAFHAKTNVLLPLEDLEDVVRQFDEAYLLSTERFDCYRRAQVESYLSNPVRPASYAGAAYAEEPEELRTELAALFTRKKGTDAADPAATPDGPQLCGIISPHIDPHRGGPAFAGAYQELADRGDADLFVIFGTGHHSMDNLFCASRKDFDTPLGIVRTDRRFIGRLAEHLASSVAGQQVDLFADELAHRLEHSIEFQAVFLQYVLGPKREFRIVPVLVGSFEEFLADGTSPSRSPEVQAFVAAVRAAAAEHPGKVCYVSAADFAHIGRQFGDEWLLDEPRLAEQAEDDRKLLQRICRTDAAGLFSHVVEQHDRRRICGLPPTFTMLEVMASARGKLLTYDQAVEPDGTACVSFASVAFYRDRPALPRWLKRNVPKGNANHFTAKLIGELGLQTICDHSRCPNRMECYAEKTATFLILGDVCTRACRFCHVRKGKPRPVDPDEPRRVADAARRLGLRHVVVTCVTRDDLPDGGAAHFCRTLSEIRRATGATVEVLPSDFAGNAAAVDRLVAAAPEVYNYNTETVPRLYPAVRSRKADYRWTLQTFRRIKRRTATIQLKTGMMLGLGETIEEVFDTWADLLEAGCRMLTLGQYLQPSAAQMPVVRYLPPSEFDQLGRAAEALGFRHVASGPLVRSSYHAGEMVRVM